MNKWICKQQQSLREDVSLSAACFCLNRCTDQDQSGPHQFWCPDTELLKVTQNSGFFSLSERLVWLLLILLCWECKFKWIYLFMIYFVFLVCSAEHRRFCRRWFHLLLSLKLKSFLRDSSLVEITRRRWWTFNKISHKRLCRTHQFCPFSVTHFSLRSSNAARGWSMVGGA